jgi:hypothetical protein
MKSPKKTETNPRTFRPADGIGFDTSVGNHYGLKNNPAVVLAIHPIHGINVYGPFLNRQAAHAWASADAPLDVGNCYGEIVNWTFTVAAMEVLGHYE